jgi:serine/threonine protein kinase/Tol biopolymer transport system component
MATVYLAHDLRHDRDVAIKVLHPDLAAALGAERFLAEIKTTAKLQHPHILPLLDSGEADGLLYYVMPYVAGESLRARLDRETQLSIDDAIRIAREVASAIESAHKQGVVHRDIKPENILLHEDQALVADFGIALAVSAAGGARMTQTGLSLGTPQYMAPEQAMGERVIDGRADIYALGAVTYEMLVGEAPFTGPTVQAIVARVMTESPRPVTGQRKSVPQNVNAAVLKALEKLPADRFSSAAEFSRALVTSDYGTSSAIAPANAQPKAIQSQAMKWAPWIIAAVAAIAAVGLGVRALPRASPRPIHLAVDLPANFELTPNLVDVVGISPDGNTIAFAAIVDGKPQLLMRRLDSDSLIRVRGANTSLGSAEFSPDGQWLAFNSDRKLWKIPVSGGTPTQVAEATWAQFTWVGNGELVYARSYDSGLYRVAAEGGNPSTLTTPDRKKGELGQWWPQLLPDGDHVLFTNYTTPANKSSIEVISLKTGKRHVVYHGGYFGRYVDGHLLFTRDAGVMEIPFDAGALKVSGTPVPVPLEIETRPSNGWSAYAVAPTGTLVYREDVLKNVEVVWVDANGNEEPALDSAARITSVKVSPDNRKIAVVRDGDVWIYERQRGVYTRLTNTEQVENTLSWTSDSKAVLYSRDVPQYDLFKRAVDGSTPEQLAVTSSNDKYADAVTLDGKRIIYQEEQPDGSDIFDAPFDASDKTPAVRLAGGTGAQSDAAMSPDGRWITYTSTESGRSEIYVIAYPLGRGPARQQVSPSGGTFSVWAIDGRAVLYRLGDRLWRVKFDPQTGDIGKPELITKVQPGFDWSVGPDGRFLISKLAKGGEHRSLKVILNWVPTLNDVSRRAK